MPDFLFPRVVRISRPAADSGVGARPYSGLTAITETTVASNIPAHIQPDRQGKPPTAGLPADAVGAPTWKVIVKLPKGKVQKRDVITDELGNRYQVVYAAWNPLVTTCLAQDISA